MINLEMPEDVKIYVREYQGRIKSKKDIGTYSLQKCIIAIIREHKQFSEGDMAKNPESPEESVED